MIVTGGRDLAAPWLVQRELFGLLDGSWLTVVHGGCPTGADAAAAEWAAEWAGVVADPFRADWDSCGWDCPPGHRIPKRPGDVMHPGFFADYCPGAGPRRNARMIEAGADLMLAFPTAASRGTWNAVRLARAAGIEVRVVRP